MTSPDAPANLEAVMLRLQENAIPYGTIRVGARHEAILLGRGGHLLGPFDQRDGSSAFWLNPAWGDGGAFAEFLAGGNWNVGGLRMWIAPEIRFGVKDRKRYWETLTVQASMEPDAAEVDRNDRGDLSLNYQAKLKYYNPDAPAKSLRLERRVRAVPNPLASLTDGSTDDLEYFGFAHDCRIAQDTRDGNPAEVWNLVQVWGGGRALIPLLGDLAYADYYEPLPASHLALGDRFAVLKLDGTRRFKIGVAAHCHIGRIGHIREVGGETELVVCSYHNDPSARYAEQPAGEPDRRGLSMHFYNDGGMFGGFGELEANGRTIGVDGMPDELEDSFSVWCYRGDKLAVAAAAHLLLGIRDAL